MSRFIPALAFLLSALAPALSAQLTYACSCVPPEPGRVVEFADAIIIGTIAQVELPTPGLDGMMSSLDPATVSVTAERYLKGSGASRLQFTTANSGASCGALEVLRAGERHILFLKGDGGGYTTDLCSGNAPLGGMTLDGVDGQTYLAQIETLTGPGAAPTGPETPLSRPGVGLSPIMTWSLIMAGAAGALVLATVAALVVRRRGWP